MAESNWFKCPNIVFDLGLKPKEMVVYMYIMRCENNGSTAYPSYSTIAEKCGISRRSAVNAINELEEKGLLVKTVRRNGDLNQSNVYTTVDKCGAKSALGGVVISLPSARLAPNKELDHKELDYKEIMDNGAIEIPNRPSYTLFKKLNSKGRIDNIDEPMENIRYFFRRYKEIFKRDHPALKNEQVRQAYERFREHDEMFSVECGREIIDQYFETQFPTWDVDYNLMHFISGEIIDMRAFEVM